jgi:hypothetical protein
MNKHWIIQSNLGHNNDHIIIAKACCDLKIDCTLVHVVPFSKELPYLFSDIPTVFYGSTRFVNRVFKSRIWSPAAFFDSVKFTVSHWGPIYKEQWFNYGSKFTTLKEFIFEPHPLDQLFFVRPVKDLKEFTGSVWSFKDLIRWNTGLLKTDLGDEQLATTPIVVGEPYGINREWRLFMVDGKVCQASQYRKGHELNISPEVPKKVIDFGEKAAAIFSPHPIFVLDVCESADNLYVLEVGCANSAGFYACNVYEIVKSISEWIDKQ